MNITVTFRGMDHSNAIQEYAQEALEKVFKFIEKEPEPIKFEIILEAHRQHHHHKVEIRMHSKHFHFMIHHEGPDLYQEIDWVVKHLVDEIKKQKNKHLDERNHTPDPARHVEDDLFQKDKN